MRTWQFIGLILISMALASATLPQALSIQGRLISGGLAADGSHNITFRIYNVSSGGVVMYSQLQTIVVSQSLYNAVLTGVGLSFDTTYWLALQVDSDPEMSPRIEMSPSPYAYTAYNLDPTRNYEIQNLTISDKITFWNNYKLYAPTSSMIELDTNFNVTGVVYADQFCYQDGSCVSVASVLPLINWLNVTKLNVTDQRYNETYLINALNQTMISGAGDSGVVPVFTGNREIGNSSITHCTSNFGDTVGVNSNCDVTYQDSTMVVSTNWLNAPGTISTIAYDDINNVTILSISGGIFPVKGIASSIYVTDTTEIYYIVEVPSTTDMRISGNHTFTNSTWKFKQAPYISVSGDSYEERGIEFATAGNWNWAIYIDHSSNNQKLCFQNSVFPTTNLMCLSDNGDLDIYGTLNPSAVLSVVPKYAGFTVEPTFVDNGNGTLTFSNDGVVNLYDNYNGTGVAQQYSLTGGTTGVEFADIPIGQTAYVVANYNSGSPEYQVTTNRDLIHQTNVVPLLTVFRNAAPALNEIYILNWDSMGNAMPEKMNDRMVRTERYAHESGMTVGELPGRYLTSSAGVIWFGVVRLDISPVDTNLSGLDMWFHDSFGNYTVDDTYDYYQNQYWDNGTALVPLDAGTFSNIWVYERVSEPSEIDYIVGHTQYNFSADAAAEQPPSSLPDAISSNYVLIGRVTFEVNASTATYVDSTWGVSFTGMAVSDHNALGGLQGGAGGEYYHLASLDYQNVIDLPTKLNTTYLDMSTTVAPPDQIGRVFWDVNNHALAVDSIGGTTLQVGQELYVLVHNNNAFTIGNGKLVYISGATTVPTISLASASTPSLARVLGMVTADILPGEHGFVTTYGIVHDVNTFGLSIGAPLYLSTVAGEFTSVAPTPPNWTAPIGIVTNVGALDGNVFVNVKTDQTRQQTNYQIWVQNNVTAQNFFGNINASYVQNAPWATSSTISFNKTNYSEMYNSTSGGTLLLGNANIWSNATGFSMDTTNGWYMNNSTMVCNQSGVYSVSFSITFTGSAADQFQFQVAVDSVADPKSLAGQEVLANKQASIGVNFLRSFSVGEHLMLQARDIDQNAKTITFYNRNIMLQRVG